MNIENNKNNKDNNNNKDITASFYTDKKRKKTDINIKIDKNNLNSQKITIEKKINVADSKKNQLSQCQSELLNDIYRTTSMAIQAIETIFSEICTDEVKNEIKNELNSYKDINNKSLDMMKNLGIKPDKANPIAKALRQSSIKLSAITKKCDSDIAEMMINGTTLGIIDIMKSYNACKHNANEQPKPLADELLNLLRLSIDKLVTFL